MPQKHYTTKPQLKNRVSNKHTQLQQNTRLKPQYKQNTLLNITLQKTQHTKTRSNTHNISCFKTTQSQHNTNTQTKHTLKTTTQTHTIQTRQH